MKYNKWTLGLAAMGVVSLASVAQAEEKLSPVQTALSATTISGYVDTSVHWNLGSGVYAAPYAFSAGKQDGFNLNVVKLTIEKPLDESTWAAGYKVDLIFGPDATGFNTSANAFPGASDFSVKQAYVALRAPVGNGIDFKIGTFDTIIGYEVFEAGNNPNYTRSYGYTIEPTQHTGVLASYQLNQIIGFNFGIANTLLSGINVRSPRSESHKTYMGSITFTAPDDSGILAGSAIYAGVVRGYGDPSFASNDNQTSYYLGGTFGTPIAGLRVGAAFDYVDEFGGTGEDAWAAAFYGSFQLSEKAALHARAEVARNELGNTNFGVFGSTEVFGLTGTLQYDLWKNVISRLEVRWDRAMEDEVPGTKKNDVLVAANLIYKF